MTKRVLIVEDEPDIRELIALTLRMGGLEVFEASNGEAGVARAREVMPDLILMDVRMPRLDGFQACQMLKAAPDTQEIPVVFLSARGQVNEVQHGMDAGALEYIITPFAPDELLQQVQGFLAR